MATLSETPHPMIRLRMFPIKIYPLCEKALCIDWGNCIDEEINSNVTALNRLLLKDPFLGFIETVPAYSTLTIYYQPELVAKENNNPFLYIKNYVEDLLPAIKISDQSPVKIIEVPVCYDHEFGPDLEFVAASNHLTKEEVIAIHCSKEYSVYMMGFLPGFAYMGELEDAIATPRKKTPRANVENGSVGIAGKQTGIYPITSPGGWQIIGRTTLKLFDMQNENPFALKTGDRVRFIPFSKKEFINSLSLQKQIQYPAEEIKPPAAMIIRPGPGSTIQDKGRWGFQSFGVPVCGAMDELAFSQANALVGNPKESAVIECTMGGLLIQCRKKLCIAITGAGAAFVNHRPIKNFQPLTLWVNDLLEIKYNHDGIRTYVSVAGGFAAPRIMNSLSTYAPAGIGHFLKKGEELYIEQEGTYISGKMDPDYKPNLYSPNARVRVMDGPEMDWMEAPAKEGLWQQDFLISVQSGRMGLRLKAKPLSPQNKTELVSTAVTKGTIQLTPDGQLIILMSDSQTTGGYPRIAQVAAVDLPILAQLKPGDSVRFENITPREAEELFLSWKK